MYDIVVIGGNLSGVNAAIHASEDGVKVALIEKNNEPFLPSHCGECIDYATAELLLLDAGRCVRNEINTVIANVSSLKDFVFKFDKNPLIVFDRNYVEKTLLKKAEKLGVDLFIGKRLIDFKPPNDMILDDRTNIRGEIVIDASGIACKVGRKKGLYNKIKPRDIGVCIQSRVKSRFDADKIKAWFHLPYAPFGYAWIFPIDENIANIGLGIPGGQHIDLEKKLELYISDMLNDEFNIISTFRACVPIASPLSRIVKDNVMVVGDAARFVNSLFGNGIDKAVLSGILAGKTAAKYINGEISNLEPYQNAMQFIISRLNRSHFLKSKLNTDKKYVWTYKMIFYLLSLADRIFPNYIEKGISKTLEKNKLVLRTYN